MIIPLPSHTRQGTRQVRERRHQGQVAARSPHSSAVLSACVSLGDKGRAPNWPVTQELYFLSASLVPKQQLHQACRSLAARKEAVCVVFSGDLKLILFILLLETL